MHNWFSVQVLEAQRRHQKEKSGIIPTSPTPYTYNKVRLTSAEYRVKAYSVNPNQCLGLDGKINSEMFAIKTQSYLDAAFAWSGFYSGRTSVRVNLLYNQDQNMS